MIFFDADNSIDFTDGHGEHKDFQLEIDELLKAYEMKDIKELFAYFENKYKGNCLVAEVLGYKNPSNALTIHIDKGDKTSYLIQVSGSNYKANTCVINESGGGEPESRDL